MSNDYPASHMHQHYSMQGNTNQSSNATSHPGHAPSPQLGSPHPSMPSPSPSAKTGLNDSVTDANEENGPSLVNGVDTASQKDEESSDSMSQLQKQVRAFFILTPQIIATVSWVPRLSGAVSNSSCRFPL